MSLKDLPIPIQALVVTGAWCPDHWSGRRRIIYKFYSLIASITLFMVNSSQLARLVFVKSESFEEFNDTFNVALAVNALCFEFTITQLNHDKIAKAIKMLQKDCCQPRDEIERRIQKDYDNFSRKLFVRCEQWATFTGTFISFAPLTQGIGDRVLPFQVLLPYNLTNPTVYGLTYAQHAFTNMFGGVFTVSIYLTMISFLQNVCCQIDILKYRIEELPSKVINDSRVNRPDFDRLLTKDIVQYHVHLYDVTEALNKAFGGIVIYRFYIYGIEISATIYQLSLGTSDINVQAFLVLYIIIMFGQLFLVCYFGNKLVIKSTEIEYAVYNCNWDGLAVERKKDLFIIMMRSSKAMMISTRAFVDLNLDTFVKIVKTSYSGFNILKTST